LDLKCFNRPFKNRNVPKSRREKITATATAFAMNVDRLLELMESKDKIHLDELGGVDGLSKSLGSDMSKGLTATTEQDLNDRRKQYGENILQRKPPPSVLEMFKEAIQDTTLVILMMAAGAVCYDRNFSLKCILISFNGLGRRR
jgi:hypothetical protein